MIVLWCSVDFQRGIQCTKVEVIIYFCLKLDVLLLLKEIRPSVEYALLKLMIMLSDGPKEFDNNSNAEASEILYMAWTTFMNESLSITCA